MESSVIDESDVYIEIYTQSQFKHYMTRYVFRNSGLGHGGFGFYQLPGVDPAVSFVHPLSMSVSMVASGGWEMAESETGSGRRDEIVQRGATQIIFGIENYLKQKLSTLRRGPVSSIRWVWKLVSELMVDSLRHVLVRFAYFRQIGFVECDVCPTSFSDSIYVYITMARQGDTQCFIRRNILCP
jgi:hypothetical protein